MGCHIAPRAQPVPDNPHTQEMVICLCDCLQEVPLTQLAETLHSSTYLRHEWACHNACQFNTFRYQPSSCLVHDADMMNCTVTCGMCLWACFLNAGPKNAIWWGFSFVLGWFLTWKLPFFRQQRGEGGGGGGGRVSGWDKRGGHMLLHFHAGELLLVQKNNPARGIILRSMVLHTH